MEESPEVLVKKKNIIIDATLFSSLMSCPRYMDMKFNHSFVPLKGKSNSLEVGSIVHKVMEVYYQQIIDGFKRETAIGNALIAGQLYITGCPHCADALNPNPVCRHQPGEYPGVFNTPEESEHHRTGWKWALKTCEQYFDYYSNDAWVPLFVEKVVGKILYEDDELRILWKAKIDLAVDTNQGIYPVDHKTFKQRRDKSTLSNQFLGQALVMEVRNVIVNKIGFQTTLKPAERFTREVISFSADRLFEWQSEILPYYAYKLIQYEESGYYPPDYTHCDNIYGACMFKSVCESDRNMRAEELALNFTVGPKWDPTNPDEE